MNKFLITTSSSSAALVGENLDLSTWSFGDDDEEDRDSSIDQPLSPLPNIHNCSDANLSGQFTQVQEGSWRAVQEPDNISQPNVDSVGIVGKRTIGQTDSPQVQLQSSESNNQEKQENSLLAAQPPKEQLRSVGKKVEFSEVTSGKSATDLKSKAGRLAENTHKGLFSKKYSRSSSGNLLNEIRKMSLASQDAEEEKRQHSTAVQLGDTQSTKRKRHRKRKKREEEYTDKDRAAAVTLGTRDIKQSLKAKKKRERKMRLCMEFLNSEEYLSSMLVVEALYQMRVKKEPSVALLTLNKALELHPTHKGALVARSQCHLKLGDASSALKDAETSFGQNETFIQGLYQYAEALYQLGEFEKSLIAFHQGHRLRPDLENFRIGVQKAQDAIRKAIGDRSATRMDNLDEILSIIEEFQSSKKKAANPMVNDEELLLNIMRRRYGDKVSRTKASMKSKNRIITREVLGQMYRDKEYLAKFVHRPEVQQQLTNANALQETAREGLQYLENREKFWRQQNPLYSRKTMNDLIENRGILSKVSSVATSSQSLKPGPYTSKNKGKLEHSRSEASAEPSFQRNVN